MHADAHKHAVNEHMVIIGLSGCTGAGKSTLCEGLARHTPLRVVSCDDFFLPKEDCPRFDLMGLPWENGVVPAAFAKRGDADTNVPASVDWEGVLSAVDEAVASAPGDVSASSTIIVDGLLLFGDHPGAQKVLARCDHCAVMWTDGDDAKAILRTRKYTRSHLGKPSYQQRGVSEAEYSVYFDHYVWPSWLTHGASRVPPEALKLESCRLETDALVEMLLATGWFPTLT